MSNPTLISIGVQKHVRLGGAYRTNTLAELSARIIGSSSRLRGLEFVSENIGTDVTLAPGDFISVGLALDLSLPNREAGIIARTENNSTIDVSGFTDPAIYAFASNTSEGTAVQFLVTEASPAPTTQHAPIIYRIGGVWISSPAIGNDSLSNAGIFASGSDTIPAGIASSITIAHGLGLGSYKVILQPTNLSSPVYGANGLTTSVEAGEIWSFNELVNSFQVKSDSDFAVTFDWAVIA